MAVVEVETFRLASTEQEFRAADQRMQTDFVYQQPGCLRRTTARDDDGGWLVLTWWADADSAATARAAEGHPVAAEFWKHVAADTVDRRRFTLLGG